MSELEPATDPAPDLSENDDDLLDEGRTPPKAPVREGLPKSYRMRADAHYVDLLTSRSSQGRELLLPISAIESAPRPDVAKLKPLVDSIARHGVLQPLLVQERRGGYRLIAGLKRLTAAFAAGLNEIPCRLYDVDDEEAARLAVAANTGSDRDVDRPAPQPASGALDTEAHLARALRTLTACANMMTSSEGDLPRQVAGNLLRAEAWRAICLLHAQQVVKSGSHPASALVPAASIPAIVVGAFAPERSVRNVVFEVESHVASDTALLTDERLLTSALANAVVATLSVVEGMAGAKLTVSVRAEAGGEIVFAVSQNSLAVPDVWFARAFDQTWTDRPGGVPAALALVSVQRTAVLLGGDASVARSGRGTTINLRIPVVDGR